MTISRLALALAVVALASCRANPTTSLPKGPKPKTAVTAAKADLQAVTPVKPVTPVAETPAEPTEPATRALELLGRPATPSTVLKGTISLDATYALSTGRGELIGKIRGPNGVELIGKIRGADLIGKIRTPNGGDVLIPAGSALLDADGNLISDQGGNLIADSSGNLIGKIRGTTGIIANNGGAIVANNGGGIIANNGGALTAKVKYQLAATEPEPEASSLVPAAGLILGVTRLSDGAPVPLGADEAGEPVFHVLADAKGGFELYVPADLAGNVAVRAVFPGEPDEKLAYDLIARINAGATLSLDEDIALANIYIRRAWAEKLEAFIAAKDPEATAALVPGAGPLRPIIVSVIGEFQAAAREVGLDQVPREILRPVARRMADAVLAHVDLTSIKLNASGDPAHLGPEEPAVAAMAEVMGYLRNRARTAFAGDVDFFGKQPFLLEFNLGRPTQVAIKVPTDLGRFIANEVLLAGNVPLRQQVFVSIDALFDPKTGVNQSTRMSAAAGNIAMEIGRELLANPNGGKDEALAILRAWKPAP